MLAAQFFVWWYGEGWRDQARLGRKRIDMIFQAFSAPLLISTLFSPWRKIVSYPDESLSAKMHAAGDNLVSRAVGFTVRLLVLRTMTAAVLLIGISVVVLITLIAWPLIPLLIVAGFVKGAM